MLDGKANQSDHTMSDLIFLCKLADLEKTGAYNAIAETDGARFRVSDGKCTSGPCFGQSLTPVKVTIRKDEIFLIPVQY